MTPFVQAVLVKTQSHGRPDQVYVLRVPRTRRKIEQASMAISRWTEDPRLDFNIANGIRMCVMIDELIQEVGTEAEDAAATAGSLRRTGIF